MSFSLILMFNVCPAGQIDYVLNVKCVIIVYNVFTKKYIKFCKT